MLSISNLESLDHFDLHTPSIILIIGMTGSGTFRFSFQLTIERLGKTRLLGQMCKNIKDVFVDMKRLKKCVLLTAVDQVGLLPTPLFIKHFFSADL